MYSTSHFIHRLTDALIEICLSLLVTIIVLWIAIAVVRWLFSFLKKLHMLHLQLRFRPEGIIPLGRAGPCYVGPPNKGEGHIAVVSQTGGGKTHKLLIQAIDAWDGTGFYIDISGDIVGSVQQPNRLVFEPLSVDTVVYDPFGSIRALAGESERIDALDTLAYALIPEEATNDNAKYFERAGRDVLAACLITYYFEGYSFLETCDKIASSSFDILNQVANIGHPEALVRIVKFSDMGDKELANIYDTPHSAVAVFRSPAIRNAFDTSRDVSSFTAEDIESSNIFLVIPDGKTDQYSSVLRLLTTQVLSYLSGRNLEKTTPVLLALDEFGSMGRIPISGPLEKYRKRHVRIIILFQSVSQLARNYSSLEKEVIFDNIRYTVCLGVNAPSSQAFLAELIGKRAVLKKTINPRMGITLNETIRYPVEPYKFGKCDRKLFVICGNEYITLRKNRYR